MTDLGMPRSLPGREQRRGQLRGLGRVSFRCGEAQSNFFSLSMGLGLPSRDFGRAIFPHGWFILERRCQETSELGCKTLGMMEWGAPRPAPQQNNHLTSKNHSSQVFKVPGNCPKGIKKVEKRVQENLSHLNKNSKSAWHLRHSQQSVLSLPHQCYRSSAWAPCSRRAQPGRRGLLLPPVMIPPWEGQAARTSHLPWAHVAEALCRQGWPRRWGFPERWGVCLPTIPGLGRSPGAGNSKLLLAWEIPWTEEPGKLHSRGLPRVRHDWTTKHTNQPRRPDFPFYNGKESAKYIYIYIKLSYTFETNTTS